MGMLSGKTWVLRWPALPVLTDFMNTLVAKAVAQAMGAVKGVTFMQSPWFAEARVEVTDENMFRGSLAHVIRRGGDRLSQLKAMIVTVGMSGDTQQLAKVVAELGLSPAEGKTYDQIAGLVKGFAERYDKGQFEVSSDWRVSVKDRVEVKLGSVKEKGYPLPSLVRSVSLYEGGRFSGFKDERASGSLGKGVLEARSDAAWWTLILAAAGASLTTVERAQEESRYVFACFEPVYGLQYESMIYYQEFTDAVEDFVEKVGLFVEDEELFRLSLLFYVYRTLSSPLIPARFGIKLRSVRAVGRRFTEAYVTSISTGEVEVLHRALQSYVGGLARDAARACSELGRFVMTTQRNAPAIARELNLDTFASRLKILMRALSEPGYAPPSEPLYDMLRMMKVSVWEARFIGLLSSRIREWRGIPKEEANREAKEVYARVLELAATVAKSLR
ncbi:MAG: hypothetical protein QW185_04990 [Thermofilum sp.]